MRGMKFPNDVHENQAYSPEKDACKIAINVFERNDLRWVASLRSEHVCKSTSAVSTQHIYSTCDKEM